MDDDPVGNHRRAAGHCRAIAAGFTDDGSRFTGYRRLVDRSDAFDHIAVAGDDVTGFDKDKISGPQIQRRDRLKAVTLFWIRKLLGLRLDAAAAQGIRLRLAAAFRHRFGEIGEQYGEPQPEDDLEGEAGARVMLHQVAYEQYSRQRGDNLEHKDHRILDQCGRVELDEGLANRRPDDLRIEQRGNRHPLSQFSGVHNRNSDLSPLRIRCPPASRDARPEARARARERR